MLKPSLVLAAVLILSGCGGTIAGSRYNPVNWLGQNAAPTVAPTGPLVPAGSVVAVVDTRVALTVTGVEVARTGDGALVRATGLAPAPGYFNAQLARAGVDGGVLVLRFVAEAPASPASGNRQITAATTVSASTLAGLSGVRVEGATGALSAGF
jgi:hypothetical protein